LFSSSDFIEMIQAKKARMEMTSAYTVSILKPGGKRPLGRRKGKGKVVPVLN
jgi:hypothetical protein